MRSKVLSFIQKENLIQCGDTVIVALSGGADSVCLLNILNSLKEELSISVEAFHLNHNLRGQEANRDERFVIELCHSLKIPLHVESVNVQKYAEENSISTESAGREVRYSYFNSLIEQYACKIATAHNADDNVETTIFNLARGTFLKGLCGIPTNRDNIIRPILCCSREEIEQYLCNINSEFMTDSTNLQDIYTRNKIRHSVIPVLKEVNPSLTLSVERLNQSCKEALDFITSSANEIILKANESAKNKLNKDGFYDIEIFKNTHKALQNQITAILLSSYSIPVFSDTVALVAPLFYGDGTVTLNQSYKAVSKQGFFRIVEKTNDKAFTPTKLLITEEFSYDNKQYSFSNVKISGKLRKNALQNLLKFGIITDKTVIRNRRAKDMFTPYGRNCTKSVKKIMNEMKIPEEFRDKLMLIANDSEVLWIEGIGVSQKAAYSDLTEDYIQISINEMRK